MVEERDNMIPSNDRNYQAQMAWVQKRLEALEKMEAKLREMRALAIYAAGKTLAPREAAQVQEWMNVLHREVVTLDKESAWNGEDDFVH